MRGDPSIKVHGMLESLAEVVEKKKKPDISIFSKVQRTMEAETSMVDIHLQAYQ